MVEIKFHQPDYVALHRQLATLFKTTVKDNSFIVPPECGKGWAWTEKLPCGITIMVSDTELYDDHYFTRPSLNEQYFALQFNDTGNEMLGKKIADVNINDVQLSHSYIILTDTLSPASYVLPKGVRLRSVKFFFSKKQLCEMFNNPAVDMLVTQALVYHIQQGKPMPIDVSFRPIIDELLVQFISQPLKVNFIQNRLLLLLEIFIDKKLHQYHFPTAKIKLSESEVERLMKVEALLVKDHSQMPPTIEALSKICAMSPTKLKNDFKLLYGLPIYEYYQKNRMAKAKSLLLEGSYNVKEAGIMVGYSNLSHFAAAFKKELGILPSELLEKKSLVL